MDFYNFAACKGRRCIKDDDVKYFPDPSGNFH